MKLNAIFTSNMVFAAFQPIRICGTGEGSAKINFVGIEMTIESDSGNSNFGFPNSERRGVENCSKSAARNRKGYLECENRYLGRRLRG